MGRLNTGPGDEVEVKCDASGVTLFDETAPLIDLTRDDSYTSNALRCNGAHSPVGSGDGVAHSTAAWPTCLEALLLVIASVAAMLNGITPILFYYFFGTLVGELSTDGDEVVVETNDETKARIQHTSLQLFYVAALAGVSGFVQRSLFVYTAERVIQRIRRGCFRSLTAQEIAFFDQTEVGTISARIAEDGVTVRDMYGSGIGMMFVGISQLVAGMAFSFVLSWKLTVGMLAIAPLLGIVIGVDALLSMRLINAFADASAVSMCVVEEVFSNIRIVRAFRQERREVNRYKQSLEDTMAVTKKKAVVRGVSDGLLEFLIWGACAFAFWVGGWLVGKGELDFGDLVTVFGMMIFAILGLSEAVAQFGELLEGYTAYKRIAEYTERVPRISRSGRKTDMINGKVSFEDVSFTYEGRTSPALKHVSFAVPAGKTVAVVGHSGGGKSTLFALLQRFYEPDTGNVQVDGINVAEYESDHLRAHMAIVTQQPVLFSTTIRENITYGRANATDEEVMEAARVANAHDFIMEMPHQYETKVGGKGVSLSGGQRQRISIARAVLCNPRILLLDEATASLDTQSERLVQDALERVMVGRTSLVIAHRLSTVQNADSIVVLEHGEVVEQGTHSELLAFGGVYSELAQGQQLSV